MLLDIEDLLTVIVYVLVLLLLAFSVRWFTDHLRDAPIIAGVVLCVLAVLIALYFLDLFGVMP